MGQARTTVGNMVGGGGGGLTGPYVLNVKPGDATAATGNVPADHLAVQITDAQGNTGWT